MCSIAVNVQMQKIFKCPKSKVNGPLRICSFIDSIFLCMFMLLGKGNNFVLLLSEPIFCLLKISFLSSDT